MQVMIKYYSAWAADNPLPHYGKGQDQGQDMHS